MKQNVLLVLGCVFSYLTYGQTISTSSLSSTSFCQDDQTQVGYTITGSYNSGNTFYVELSDASGGFTSPDTIGSQTTTSAGNILVTLPAPINPGSGYRVRVVSDNPVVIGSDNGQNISVDGTTLSDTIFGTNEWHVFAYESDFGEYKGHYVDTNLNILTTNFFTGFGSPSSATGYEGCTVGIDNHDFIYKREGFPCGLYSLNVRGDDAHRVYLDGALIYSSGYTSSIQNGVWSGYLYSTSRLEIQLEEDGGISALEVEFDQLSGLSLSPNLTVCAGETVTIGASGGINYDWSANTTNVISPTNIDSITVAVPMSGTPGSSETYIVTANDTSGVCALQDSVTVTISATAVMQLSSDSASICDGNTINVSVVGASAFLWFPDSSIIHNNTEKSSVTINATKNATYRVTGNGTCASDTADFVINGEITGDTAVYGNEEWIFYGFDGNNFNTYKGFYTFTSTSINTRNDWNQSNSPSSAVNWEGCDLPDNQHSFMIKREGFDCGYYQMDIPFHDDAIVVKVDGEVAYSKNSWYALQPQTNVWQGYLGSTSKVVVTIREYGGESSAGITLTPLYGPAVNANHTVWTGDTDTDWMVANNWCGGVPSSTDTAFLLDRNNDPVIDGNISIGGLWIEQPLNVNFSDFAITVAGAIENYGSVTLSNTGSIMQSGTTNRNSGTGTFAIERASGTLANNTRYNFWSMPLSDETVEDVFPNSNPVDFYTFTTGSYVTETGTVTPGIGFTATGDIVASYPRSFTRTFTGSDLNNGSITVTGLSTGSVLLGNPYPSGLDVDAFAAANANLDNDYYFWDHNTDEIAGENFASDWAQYNTAMGSGTAAGSGSLVPTGNIGSAQGFFVDLTSGSSVTYANSHRTSTNNQFFKRKLADRNLAWLNLTNDGNDFNQILIGFLPIASDDKDASDGPKLSVNPNVSFYSVLEEEQLGIQGLPKPLFEESKVIELGVVANVVGQYTIELDSTFNWPEEYDLVLVDRAMNRRIDLITTNSYTFDVHQADTLTQRFYLNVTNTEKDKPTSTEEVESDKGEINIYQASNLLWIDAHQSDAVIEQIELITVIGKTNRVGTMNNRIHSIDLSQYTSGIYFVRLKTNQGDETHKVFIR